MMDERCVRMCLHCAHTSGTLVRETGTEHILHEKHQGWKTQDLAHTKEKDEEARRKADNIYHGQEMINKVAVVHKESKMTPAELAAHQARRKAEDEANIKAADEYVIMQYL